MTTPAAKIADALRRTRQIVIAGIAEYPDAKHLTIPRRLLDTIVQLAGEAERHLIQLETEMATAGQLASDVPALQKMIDQLNAKVTADAPIVAAFNESDIAAADALHAIVSPPAPVADTLPAAGGTDTLAAGAAAPATV